MAFDGAYLYTVARELTGLIGCRVDRIHQPTRDEVLLRMRGREGAAAVLVSVSGGSARIHLTQIPIESPAAPPMFCMLLRKHLSSGKLTGVRQEGLERILFLEFQCVDELGDVVQKTLACEVMGRYSNCVLIDGEG